MLGLERYFSPILNQDKKDPWKEKIIWICIFR